MKYISAPILSNTAISPELFVMELKADIPIKAGQFIMIKLPDNARILPRPISVFNYDPSSKTLSLLIRKRGAGSELLSTLTTGSSLDIFGGLGKGFDSTHNNKKIILMGGGEGIAPMLLCSNLLKEHNDITILAGFRHEVESSCLDYFDQDLDISYTALDHQEQCARGFVTDLLDNESEPDYIYTCGPIPMIEAIHRMILAKNWNTLLFASMESHMACGVGACMGCTIKNNDNKPLRVCSEGPVFSSKEIFHV